MDQNPNQNPRKVIISGQQPPGAASHAATARPAAPAKVVTPTRVPPDPARAAKGLSLVGLLRKEVPYVRAKAKTVVIKKLVQKTTRAKSPAVVAHCMDTTGSGHPHVVTVIGMDPAVNTICKQKRIKVDCSCDDFCFTAEYALWTWGAANIKRSNGDPAVVKNPSSYPYYCKHIDKVLRTIKAQGF